MSASAIISPCGRYRYVLGRQWSAELPMLGWIMLNPSTADAEQDDATIRVCVRRAKAMQFGAIVVVNLFALRSTSPKALYDAADPVGPDNFEHIVNVAKACPIIVCAWGTHGSHCGMGDTIRTRLSQFYPGKSFALRINADGSPGHPLYIPAAAELIPFA